MYQLNVVFSQLDTLVDSLEKVDIKEPSTKQVLDDIQTRINVTREKLLKPLRTVEEYLRDYNIDPQLHRMEEIETLLCKAEQKIVDFRVFLRCLEKAEMVDEAECVFQSLKEMSTLRALTVHERCLLHVFGYEDLFSKGSDTTEYPDTYSELLPPLMNAGPTETPKLEDSVTSIPPLSVPALEVVSSDFIKELSAIIERKFHLGKVPYVPSFDFQKFPQAIEVTEQHEVRIDIVETVPNMVVNLPIEGQVQTIEENRADTTLDQPGNHESEKPTFDKEPVGLESSDDSNWESISIEQQ